MSVISSNIPKLAVLILLILLSCACSSEEPQDGQTAEPVAEEEERNEAAQTEDGFPRIVEAANGQMTIEEKPQRVAVIHWGFADSLLLFDVPAAALALPFTEKRSVLHTDSYQPYVSKFEELVIVGENEQVNMEALLAFEPDLIIAGSEINQQVDLDHLKQIAPTYVVDEQKYVVWEDWPALVTLFGEILGEEEQASRFLADFHEKAGAAKEKLADLSEDVLFVQVREDVLWVQGTNHLSLYYDTLQLTSPDFEIMKEGGQLSLEGLSELDPSHLFLGCFNIVDPSMKALTDEWEDSAVWQGLKAVQNGQVYPINGELALGYGPIGQSYGIDEVIKALE
ncbi:ABC transporter substrate-binding protein [Alkalihalobacillus oceani]|uniref:ABC transporter substrate-binding protein n=1 Tax=Halalkalibacter oceani TaxID=1653776 RepID=UPI00203E8F84|nr:ABC transporter substrate-binding protein [Halalkalibacter oceani]MCM3759732.1 ABC transporter substrate-binding protein [Halalkalibacter oceani]